MARFMKAGDITFCSTVLEIVLSARNSQRGIFLMRGITLPPGHRRKMLRVRRGLQENGLAVGWSITLHGFASIFVPWRREGALFLSQKFPSVIVVYADTGTACLQPYA